MNKLMCETCGSTNLIKSNGVFVCQSCGCKYTLDEVKKIVLRGSVDISGSTVRVDTATELSNLYQIARRARDENNTGNAAKYYEKILMKDPKSWEASFYTVYFRAMSCKIAEIRSAAISICNCEKSAIELIKYYVPKEKQYAAVAELALRSFDAAKQLSRASVRHFNSISESIRNNYLDEVRNNVSASISINYTCGDIIYHFFGDQKEIALVSVEMWNAGIEMHNFHGNNWEINVLGNNRKIKDYRLKIDNYYKKYDPAVFKERKIAEMTNNKKKLEDMLKEKESGVKLYLSTSIVIGFITMIAFLIICDKEGLIAALLSSSLGITCLVPCVVIYRDFSKERTKLKKLIEDAQNWLEDQQK